MAIDLPSASDIMDFVSTQTSNKLAPKFNELRQMSDKLNVSKKMLEMMGGQKMSEIDREIAQLQLEIREKNLQLSSDMEYYEKYLLPMKNEGEDTTSKLANYPTELKAQLEAMNSALKEEIDKTINSEPVDIIEFALSVMVDNFTKALEPFLKVPNLPEIPIIGDLNNLINTLGRMGKVEKMIQDSLTPEQKKQWQELTEQQNEGKSIWQRMRESSIGQTTSEICQTVWEIIKLLPTIINFFWLALLKELIDLLKPVFDAFGIAQGTFMGLIKDVPNLLTSAWDLATSLGYKLMKVAYAKVENIFSIFYLIGDVQASVDDQINILQRDVLSCRYDITEKNLELNKDFAFKAKDNMHKTVELLKKQMAKEKKVEYKKLLSSEYENAKYNLEFANDRYDTALDALDILEAGGIEKFAESLGMTDVLNYVPAANAGIPTN